MKAFVFSILLMITIGKEGYGQIKKSDLNSNVSSQNKSNKLIVYGSDTCHFCVDTKAYLKEKKIDFIYYDVDINLLKQREMLIKLQKAGIPVDNLSLPVVDLGNKLVMNEANFENFLKKLN
ncbi:glutaredoxin family protein [uncultured Algibacter sp.]|uniref:glutaredoxin family protein n=1 Tax=uncultured Algibacter sp. TaxID=298659 RepID=UPI00263607C9|nr:glutaredoxin family protein [uncultured Algibacter sp.]